MGVPSFFKWLSDKYPFVVTDCVEKKPCGGCEVDTTAPNPNDIEFDNLYLDMNGIIHPCTHPEDKPAPANVDEMMCSIFEAVDRLFAIVRPRKVLYMAIDGVAPRAKMNQQRSRRFKAAREMVIKAETLARVRDEIKCAGGVVPDSDGSGHFDSNCITPGTPFMAQLSVCLQYYIQLRLNNHPGWRNITVVLSDASVPGEGEHKIVDFIRRQRGSPDYNPNTKHVLCGADADLIMLGLATHEPHFSIIREEFKQRPKICDLCKQQGHELTDCKGVIESAVDDRPDMPQSETNYIFVHLSILRHYLDKEFQSLKSVAGLRYDLERLIDDWIFMCFLVGNDFLPHLPSLEIREKAIDKLLHICIKVITSSKEYLTNGGLVEPKRMMTIMSQVAKLEDQIFNERHRRNLEFKRRMKSRRGANLQNGQPSFRGGLPTRGACAPKTLAEHAMPLASRDIRLEGKQLRTGDEVNRFDKLRSDSTSSLTSIGTNASEDSDNEADVVKLHEPGYIERYYDCKFGINDTSETLDDETVSALDKFRGQVAREYAIGLCWVLRYYFQGCSSWSWYFPYHYAPFAADFALVKDDAVVDEFSSDAAPFLPFQQLLGVFPAASSSHLPAAYADLMSNPQSPIIDFYPTEFKLDLNGKRFDWQAVAILPFVDADRLRRAASSRDDSLTEAERNRNRRGKDYIFIREGHKAYHFAKSLSNSDPVDGGVPLDPTMFTDALHGLAWPVPETDYSSILDGKTEEELTDFSSRQSGFDVPAPLRGERDIANNAAVGFWFQCPTFPDGHIFDVGLKDGVVMPVCELPLETSDAFPSRGRCRGQYSRDNRGAHLASPGHRMVDRFIQNARADHERSMTKQQYARQKQQYTSWSDSYHYQSHGGHETHHYQGRDVQNPHYRYQGHHQDQRQARHIQPRGWTGNQPTARANYRVPGGNSTRPYAGSLGRANPTNVPPMTRPSHFRNQRPNYAPVQHGRPPFTPPPGYNGPRPDGRMTHNHVPPGFRQTEANTDWQTVTSRRRSDEHQQRHSRGYFTR